MRPVEVRDLTYAIDGTPVLDSLSIDVEEGEFVGLIGPNGGGKTTFLQILVGIVRGWTGTVKVFDRGPLSLGELRHAVAYVPQDATSAPDFPATALDVVLMGRVPVRGLARRLAREDEEAARETLEAVGMSSHAARSIGELSGGQRQRVLIARALAARPRLLILDEPTTGIDRAAEESFFALLASLKASFGLTIIMASHDLTMVSEHCSTVACLNRRMHCHSPPEEIDHARLSELFGAHLELIVHGDVPHRVVRRHEEPSAPAGGAEGGASGGDGGDDTARDEKGH